LSDDQNLFALSKVPNINFKVVGEQLEDTSFSLNIVNNVEKNEETKCQCCDVLKADLEKLNRIYHPIEKS
jgi:hypothetical protein